MKKILMVVQFAAAILLSGSLIAGAAEVKSPSPAKEAGDKKTAAQAEGPKISLEIPLLSPRFRDVPVAVVNGEIITLQDFVAALELTHESRKPGEESKAALIDYSEILNRLITVRLIVQDAREMGMDELPEIKEDLNSNRKLIAQAVLFSDLTKDAKADEAMVEKFRREMTEQWKIESVLFEKEEDAKKMAEEIKAGKSFEEMAAKAVADKTAKDIGKGGYVKTKDLLPDIAAVVSKMKVGSVSPVIEVGSGRNKAYSLLKLEEVRYPEDPKTTEQAKKTAEEAAKKSALRNFMRGLYKKDVSLNSKLLDRLDFEAKKPGFNKMLKDKRIVATVKGEKPITVAELAKGLEKKFYHGIDRAIAEKKVNVRKHQMFEELAQERLVEREVAKREIEKSEEFKDRMKEYEDSVLFGYFIRKAMSPDVKLSEEELKAYYNEHTADYTNPEMMKLSGLVFSKKEQAESVFKRLEKGADFGWMKSNAEGQADAAKAADIAIFDGSTKLVNELPEGAQKALLGARDGDYRMYEGSDGNYYVLYVLVAAPSSERPFKEVRQEVAQKVFDRKLNAMMEDWTKKLREAGDVKVYLVSPAAEGKKAGTHSSEVTK
jgi:hypothetical protein